MMESSEQPTYDSSLEAKDLSLKTDQIVTTYEDYAGQCLTVTQGDDDQGGGQVIGYIEVQPSDTENDTTFILPPGIEFGGQQLILHQGAEGNEYIVVYSADQDQSLEETFAQGSHPNMVLEEDELKEEGDSSQMGYTETVEIPHELIKHDVAIKGSLIQPNIALEDDELKDGTDSPQMGYTESVEIPHEIVKHDVTSKVDYVNSENNCYPSESIDGADSTEMVFIPTQSVLSPSNLLLPNEENKHGKLLHLAVIAHELQSAGDIKGSSSQENEQNFDNSHDTEAVIASQQCDGSASLSQINKDTLSELITHKETIPLFPEPIVKKPAHRNVSTFSRFSSARTIGNAVSVIHTTSSTYTYDPNLRKSIQSDVSRVKEDVTIAKDFVEDSVVDKHVDSVPVESEPDHSPINVENELCIQEDSEHLPMDIDNELSVPRNSEEMNAVNELSIQEDNEHLPMNIDNELSVEEHSECLPLSVDNEPPTPEDSEHLSINAYNDLSIQQDDESLPADLENNPVEEENSLSQTGELYITKHPGAGIHSSIDNFIIEPKEHRHSFDITRSFYNKQNDDFSEEKEITMDTDETNSNVTVDDEKSKCDNNLKDTEVNFEDESKDNSNLKDTETDLEEEEFDDDSNLNHAKRNLEDKESKGDNNLYDAETNLNDKEFKGDINLKDAGVNIEDEESICDKNLKDAEVNLEEEESKHDTNVKDSEINIADDESQGEGLEDADINCNATNKRNFSISDTEFSDTIVNCDTEEFTSQVKSYSSSNVRKLRLLRGNTEISKDSSDVDKRSNKSKILTKTRFQSSFRSKKLLSKQVDYKMVDLEHSASKKLDAYEFEDSSSNTKKDIMPSTVVECDDSFKTVTNGANSVSSDIEAQKLTFQGALKNVSAIEEDFAENACDINVEVDDKDIGNSTTVAEQVPDKTISNSIESDAHFENIDSFEVPESQVMSNTEHEVPNYLQKKEIGKSPTCVEKVTCEEMPDESLINKDISDFSNSDEIIVKPPKKTYVRKRKLITQQNDKEKIELFSCEDLSNTKESVTPCLEDEKDSTSTNQTTELDNDDFVVSDIKSRVSATYNYNRKRKSVPPVVREIRTQSLRRRATQSAEDGTTNDSDDTVNETKEAESSETVENWGDILMKTSFEHQTSIPEEEDVQTKESEPTIPQSTIPQSTVPQSTVSSNKNSARQRHRPSFFTTSDTNKSTFKSGKQFDKLMSSPVKMHRPIKSLSDKRKITKKVKQMVKSRLMASPVCRHQQKLRESKMKELKMAGIKILSSSDQTLDSPVSKTPSTTQENFEYSCSNCTFGSNRVNNLIMHLKFCAHSSSPQMIDYRVDDMAKRQQIRGEDSNAGSRSKKSTHSWEFSNGSLNDHQNDSDMPCSSTSQQHSILDSDDDANAIRARASKKKFGFSEKDIVWAKKKNRFWPAIVWKLGKRKVFLYIITSPTTSEGMKVSVKMMNTCLHSFNDLEWNKKILDKAKRQADKSNFFKVVQKSDSYVRKKFLDEGKDINPKDFFTITEQDDFISAESSSESIVEDDVEEIVLVSCNNDADLSERTENIQNNVNVEETVNVEKLMDCIFGKQCDKHVLDIFNEKIESERHKMHLNKDSASVNHLKEMSWFAPFHTDSALQLKVFDYFYDLFKNEIGEKDDLSSYLYEVWIPEAIIKAISLVKDVSVEKAKDIFCKQDTRTLNLDDKSKDDIHEP